MKKLRNERGASILMALVLLLLASMVSAVILSAATSAARRIRNDREAQQDYLTVSSAAEMIRDSIQADRYYRKVTVTTYQPEKQEINGETVTVTKEPTVEREVKPPNKTMCEWLAAGIKGDDPKSPVSIIGSADTIEISVPPIAGEDGEETTLKTVVAAFQMDKDSGDITVRLHIKPENESENKNENADDEEDCRMTLTLRGNVTITESQASDDGSGGKSVKSTETTITWKSGKIVKGIKEAASEETEQ